MKTKQITNFTDLLVWQKAHDLRINILLQAKKFPIDYRFSLTDQIQRASISVGSNIAEGFGRKSLKERIQFYYIAKASLIEVQDQLIVCKDIGIIDSKFYKDTIMLSVEVHKLLNGLIKSNKNLGPRTKNLEPRVPWTSLNELSLNSPEQKRMA